MAREKKLSGAKKPELVKAVMTLEMAGQIADALEGLQYDSTLSPKQEAWFMEAIAIMRGAA